MKSYTNQGAEREIYRLAIEFTNLLKTNTADLTKEQQEKVALDLLSDLIENQNVYTGEAYTATLLSRSIQSLD